MENQEDQGTNVPVPKLVKVYLRMRTAKDLLVKNHEAEVSKLDASMDQIK